MLVELWFERVFQGEALLAAIDPAKAVDSVFTDIICGKGVPVMSREELLDRLWESSGLLSDAQLETAIEFLEEMAFPERQSQRRSAGKEIGVTKSYVEFVDKLRAKLRTSEEVY